MIQNTPIKYYNKVNIMYIRPLKTTNLKSAVAALKTKSFQFKIADFFCIQIFLMFLYWRVFRKIVLSFARSKSISVSHQLSYMCPTGYSNFNKINTHHNSNTLHYQQRSLPSTIMTFLVSGRENKLLVDRKEDKKWHQESPKVSGDASHHI